MPRSYSSLTLIRKTKCLNIKILYKNLGKNKKYANYSYSSIYREPDYEEENDEDEKPKKKKIYYATIY